MGDHTLFTDHSVKERLIVKVVWLHPANSFWGVTPSLPCIRQILSLREFTTLCLCPFGMSIYPFSKYIFLFYEIFSLIIVHCVLFLLIVYFRRRSLNKVCSCLLQCVGTTRSHPGVGSPFKDKVKGRAKVETETEEEGEEVEEGGGGISLLE